ncbi:ABC transporter ATP-binding protein, partial [Acinetobacter nosocomialis]|uniref:ABC transporter ATP-binding protein n=1 Tax=Acinetobacter nosocomialis TaxID=106654 RepID=UPI00374FC944
MSIEIRNVSKNFNAFKALDDINLDIQSGELVALLGPSGCGKTTLLRMLAGFDQPDSGEIRLNGQDLAGVEPEKRPVHTVFQSYALFPHMSVAQNIAFGLKQDGLPKAEIDERVAEMLKLVHMTQYAKRKPHQLSGGQRQAVGLARVLLQDPPILLLDEPTAAFDQGSEKQVIDYLQQWLGKRTLVITTHKKSMLALVERAVVLRQGRVIMDGPLEQVVQG